MKKLLVLLAWFPLLAYGQRDSANMAVKLNIASPFDVFYFPTVDLALEHRLGDRFSVQGEAGYQLYRFGSPDTVFITPSGHKLKLEMRFYRPFEGLRGTPSGHGSLSGFYTGFNIFYRAEKYNASILYTQKDDTTTYRDYFWTDKSAWGGNLLFGYQEIYWGRLIIDGYAGIGVLDRKITNNFRDYDPSKGHSEAPCDDLDCVLSGRDLAEKEGVGANLTLGFRVGYVIY